MARTKELVVVPNEDKFAPCSIPFGVLGGEGILDKKKKKNVFTVIAVLDEDMNKDFRKTVLKFWENNKPKKGGKKPANWKNITREDDDGNYRIYPKSLTEFDGKPSNGIAIVNHEGTKLDPAEFGNLGEGTKGRVAVLLMIYGENESDADEIGVSIILSAVKLTRFVPYRGGGAAAFGSEEGDVEAGDGF